MAANDPNRPSIFVEINENNADVKSRSIQKDGRTMTFRHQDAYLHRTGEPYPVPFRVSLNDNQAPYGPGFYMIDPASFVVGRYGDLEISRNTFAMRRYAQDPSVKAA